VATAPQASNGIATAALVVGIVSIPALFVCGIGALSGIVAIVLGAIGVSRANQLPERTGRGQAIGGLVTGALAVVITGLFWGLIVLAGSTADEFEQIQTEINSDPSDGYCDESRYLQDPDC
jgi:hypothetical protein